MFKDLICVCSCGREFKYKEAKKVLKEYGQAKIYEKVCPYCEQLGYTHISHMRYLEKRYEKTND